MKTWSTVPFTSYEELSVKAQKSDKMFSDSTRIKDRELLKLDELLTSARKVLLAINEKKL